ncbi:MAG TPA: efflux RND transporter periplasmic adaptor subunit [Phycisphaerae bacterium]|nr:efflux RND transporter periplasmic adaptor subunit [Phycisphaerae bacterium]
MKRPFIILLILALLIGVAIYYLGLSSRGEITLTGIVTTDDVIVGTQVQGRLQSLKVNQGDEVKKDELLAVIQPDQWQADMSYYEHSQAQATTKVSQSQADLRFMESQTKNRIAQAEANLAAAKAQVAQAQAELENAQLTFTREERAYKNGSESLQAYDQARTSLDAQNARVLALQKAQIAAEAAVALAQSSLEQVEVNRAAVQVSEHQRDATAAQAEKARVQLGYTEIRAPINGTVDVRAALEGEVVTPGQAIVTLINPDDLWVRADVEETYIDSIHLGDRMKVRLPSGVEREGTVFYRAVDADYATQRDVSRTKRDIRTFEVRLRCDNSKRDLALGMTAYVELPLKEKR